MGPVAVVDGIAHPDAMKNKITEERRKPSWISRIRFFWIECLKVLAIPLSNSPVGAIRYPATLLHWQVEVVRSLAVRGNACDEFTG